MFQKALNGSGPTFRAGQSPTYLPPMRKHTDTHQSPDPGAAKVSELTKHWRVCEPTARNILASHRVTPLEGHPERYRWEDIWRLERLPFVPTWEYTLRKSPLLKAKDLEAKDLEETTRKGWSARSIRRRLKNGQIPSIRLTPNVRRIRPDVADKVLHYF